MPYAKKKKIIKKKRYIWKSAKGAKIHTTIAKKVTIKKFKPTKKEIKKLKRAGLW